MKVLDLEQGSGEWLRARLGKVTGTRLKSLVGGKQARETLIYELVAEELSGQAEEIYVSAAMKWGTEHEEEAVKKYEEKTKTKTDVIGLCVSDEYPWLALSPDRLVKKGKKYVGAVEVKCPGTKTVMKYIAHGTIPDEYKWQVTNYFLVVDTLEWLDFVVYDPRILRDELKLTVMRVHRDDPDIFENMCRAKESLEPFLDEWKEVYEKVTKTQ